MEGYMRENDPARAEAMAEWSDPQHTQAVEMREKGFDNEATRLEREAYTAEMQAGARYDVEKEMEGLSVEELRQKFQEAAAEENKYAKSNLDAGNKDYLKDTTYIQLAQRRAVLQKALHEKEAQA